MKISKRTILNLCLCSGIIITCLILIAMLSGFRHEYKKFKQFLLTLAAVLLIRYIFLDHVYFLIQALVLSFFERKAINPVPDEMERESADDETNHVEYLKLRLKSLTSQLNLPEKHRDEALNLKYKQLTNDLWLYGKYFFLLLLVVVYSRNSYSYYNTATWSKILSDSYFSNYKMEKVLTIGELYYWINNTLTMTLNEGYDYDGNRIEEPGWAQLHHSKLLGVVRLQQIRHAKKDNTLEKFDFEEKDYLPGWQILNQTLPYAHKYWRIYYPWLLKRYEGMTKWLMAFAKIGSLYNYSDNNGYEVLLARDHNSSEKILNYLKEQNWLDAKTAAVFIDFTLYSADSNIFTICSLLVEQTPFGNLLWQVNVQSVELLWNINEISGWWWLLILLYLFELLEFCKVMILNAWFKSGFFSSIWNCVDFVIVLLNILLLGFTLLREYYVLHVMKTFILAKKLEFVDFRVASFFSYVANVILGFIICLATIRIWKVLQFSSIFRIFNRTFYTSSIPLLSTVFVIHIFLCGIGKAAQILNGSYSEIFSGYLKSITAILSFTFGFNTETSSNDLTTGGGVLGFILYFILMFVVAIFLINMFITIIIMHFSNARKERDLEPPKKLAYWEFLMKEYSYVINYFTKYSPIHYKANARTVTESINDLLDEIEKKLEDQELRESLKQKQDTEVKKLDEEKKRADRIQNVIEILNLQMEVLDRLVEVQSLDLGSQNEDSS